MCRFPSEECHVGLERGIAELVAGQEKSFGVSETAFSVAPWQSIHEVLPTLQQHTSASARKGMSAESKDACTRIVASFQVGLAVCVFHREPGIAREALQGLAGVA